MAQFKQPIFISVLLVALVVAAFPEDSDARRKKSPRRASGLHSVKYIQKAARGSCLAPVRSSREANAILNRNGVYVSSKTHSAHRVSTAVSVQQIEILSGGSDRYLRGLRVTFPKQRRYSRYLFGSRTVQMGRNHRNGNVAHIAHEIGHHVGNLGLYGPYKRQVPICALTRYAGKNYSKASARNEEFAEVFAAFVTHPDLLKNSRSSACRAAYRFLSEKFPLAKNFAVCNSSLLKRAADRLGAGGKMAF